MRQFHIACPYTSLPVCHCRLYAPAAQTKPTLDGRYQSGPDSAGVRKRLSQQNCGEDAKRRAQLLAIWYATAAPAGVSSLPCPSSLSLTRALYHRAMHAKLPPGRNTRLAVHRNQPGAAVNPPVSLAIPSAKMRAQAALMAAVDDEDESEFIAAKDRLDDARQELERADALLSQAQQNLNQPQDALHIPPVSLFQSNSSPSSPQSPSKS